MRTSNLEKCPEDAVISVQIILNYRTLKILLWKGLYSMDEEVS
jgi:hypothetical protein